MIGINPFVVSLSNYSKYFFSSMLKNAPQHINPFWIFLPASGIVRNTVKYELNRG
jgi:hypothetical protein